MPKATPKINRVYRKGVTAAMEPLRITFINAEYAKTPAPTVAASPIRLSTLGQTNDWPSHNEKSAPTTTTVKNPYKPKPQVLIERVQRGWPSPDRRIPGYR